LVPFSNVREADSKAYGGFMTIVDMLRKFIRAIGADNDVQPAKLTAPANAGTASAVTAAIVAALTEYRKTNS
jgi:hypothetical protein